MSLTTVAVYAVPGTRAERIAQHLYFGFKRLPVAVWRYDLRGDPMLCGRADLNVLVCDGRQPVMAKHTWPGPLAAWLVDTCAHVPDVCMNAEFLYVNWTTEIREPRWMCHASEHTLWRPLERHPVYDVGVIGGRSATAWMDEFGTHATMLDGMLDGFEDSVERAHRCRLIVECNCTRTLSFDQMNILSAGLPLLWPLHDSMEEHRMFQDTGFIGGKHLACYHDVNDGIDKAYQMLRDMQRTGECGINGRTMILSRHTFVHRAMQFLSDIGVTVSGSDQLAALSANVLEPS